MPPPPRGPSARSYLKMEWDYPVYEPKVESKDGRTVSRAARKALTREEALKVIAGDDPRPLLVLRECKVCNGTDEALLKGGIDNEKTFLLAQWFHCVKLPTDVMEEDHPFHNLFLEDKPEHLFVCAVDGSGHDPLESETSRTELWDSMRELIGSEYKKKADKSLKSIAKILDKMDVADARLQEVQARFDEVIEEEGPKSRKLKKLKKSVDEAQADCDELHEDAKKALRAELKKKKEAEKAAK